MNAKQNGRTLRMFWFVTTVALLFGTNRLQAQGSVTFTETVQEKLVCSRDSNTREVFCDTVQVGKYSLTATTPIQPAELDFTQLTSDTPLSLELGGLAYDGTLGENSNFGRSRTGVMIVLANAKIYLSAGKGRLTLKVLGIISSALDYSAPVTADEVDVDDYGNISGTMPVRIAIGNWERTANVDLRGKSVTLNKHGKDGFDYPLTALKIAGAGVTTAVPPQPKTADVRFLWDMGNPDIHEDFTLTIKTGDTGVVQGNSRTWYYQVLRWVDASNHQIVFRMSSTNSSSVVYFQNGQAGFGGFAGSMTTFYGYLLTGSPKPGPSATVEFIWDMGNPRYHEDFTLTVKTGDEGAFRGNYSTWSYRVIRWVSATNHQIMFHMGNQNSNDVVYFENGQAGFAGFASWMTTFYGYLQVVP